MKIPITGVSIVRVLFLTTTNQSEVVNFFKVKHAKLSTCSGQTDGLVAPVVVERALARLRVPFPTAVPFGLLLSEAEIQRDLARAHTPMINRRNLRYPTEQRLIESS